MPHTCVNLLLELTSTEKKLYGFSPSSKNVLNKIIFNAIPVCCRITYTVLPTLCVHSSPYAVFSSNSFSIYRLGMVDTLRLIYKENGISRGLYRGMSINYMRAIPMVAVSFSTYEVTKQLLGLDTGISIKT